MDFGEPHDTVVHEFIINAQESELREGCSRAETYHIRRAQTIRIFSGRRCLTAVEIIVIESGAGRVLPILGYGVACRSLNGGT